MLVRINQLIPVQASKDESIGTEKLSWDTSKSEFKRTSFHHRQQKRNRLPMKLMDSQKKLGILAHAQTGPFFTSHSVKGLGTRLVVIMTNPCIIIDTIDYVQGIGNGPINPLHPCPKPNTFST